MSYARADVEFAKELARGLRRLDVAVWLDVYDIEAGKSWARQIGEALDRCRAMVVVLSPASIASENSDDEWNYYLDKRKLVVPVAPRIHRHPYRLNKLQYVDFSTNRSMPRSPSSMSRSGLRSSTPDPAGLAVPSLVSERPRASRVGAGPRR